MFYQKVKRRRYQVKQIAHSTKELLTQLLWDGWALLIRFCHREGWCGRFRTRSVIWRGPYVMGWDSDSLNSLVVGPTNYDRSCHLLSRLTAGLSTFFRSFKNLYSIRTLALGLAKVPNVVCCDSFARKTCTCHHQ